jgi:hypothetical protein
MRRERELAPQDLQGMRREERGMPQREPVMSLEERGMRLAGAVGFFEN